MHAKKIAFFLALFPLALATAGGTTLPFPDEILKDEQRKPVRETVEDFTVHRQVGGLHLSGRQAVFEHLLRHPDFAASLARAAGALRYTVERRGDTEFWANDHRGLTGTLEILQARDGQMVLYAQGIYKKGIIRIPGRLALVMHSSEGRNEDSFYVENTLSGYVRFDSAVLDSLVRLFRPLVYRLMEKRTRWFFRRADRLMTKLYDDPEALLNELPVGAWQTERAELRVLLKTSQAGLGRHHKTENLMGLRDAGPRQLLWCQSALRIDRLCSRA